MGNESFERKVKQLMDGYETAPSDEVWHAIESRIGEKKKRRWFLWLLPAFFSAAVLFLFIYDNQKEDKTASAIQKTQPAQSENNALQESQQPAPVNDNTADEKINSSNKNITARIPEPGYIYQGRNNTAEKNTSASFMPAASMLNDGSGQSITQNKTAQSALIIPSYNEEKQNAEAGDEPASPASVTQDINPDSERNVTADEDDTIKTSGNREDTAIAAKPFKPKTEKYPWYISVSAAAGRASTIKPSGKKNNNADAAIWQAPNPFNPTPDVWLPLSEPSSGFTAGVEIQKKISPHIDISTGLWYQQLSTKIQTGASGTAGVYVNNTPRNNGYTLDVNVLNYPGHQAVYTSKYHFLQLPVQAGYTFTIRPSLQLRLYSGVQVQRLISSNALLTDTSGYTFTDYHSLKKTLLGVNAGFDFVLFSNKPYSFAAGPYWQQSLSLLNSSTEAGKNRPCFAGFKISYFIPQKKK